MSTEFSIDKYTQEGSLYEKLPENKLRCFACGHRCLIIEGHRGICQVRFNRGGKLFVPYGYVSSLNCDPIEKKPFFHFLPGSNAMTMGMLGCDFHCPYCQNWEISQIGEDINHGLMVNETLPENIYQTARKSGASSIVSSYNEPLITSEWAMGIFKVAKKNGLKTAYVSNGNATKEVLEFIRPYTDGFKIDLKGMKEENYRQLGGKLSTILESIARLVEMKFWVEVVTLLIPDFNDSDEELKQIAKFLISVSPNIPWHITAFYPNYKMTDSESTSLKKILRACKIGEESGLKFVYAGNLPGQVGNYENSYCPSCRNLLIKRWGFKILEMKINSDGKCPKCKVMIPGIWKN